jgi:hypothetical protein
MCSTPHIGLYDIAYLLVMLSGVLSILLLTLLNIMYWPNTLFVYYIYFLL